MTKYFFLSILFVLSLSSNLQAQCVETDTVRLKWCTNTGGFGGFDYADSLNLIAPTNGTIEVFTGDGYAWRNGVNQDREYVLVTGPNGFRDTTEDLLDYVQYVIQLQFTINVQAGDTVTIHALQNAHSLNGWMVFCPDTVNLPVEWLDFYGKAEGDVVSLHWATASEMNADYFSAEQSTNANTWKTSAQVKAVGTTDDISIYETSTKAVLGTNYYRLKQVDIDGKFEYSSIIEVTLQTADFSSVINNGSENPKLITKSVPASGVNVFDLSGNRIGKTNADGSLPSKNPGIYFAKFDDGSHVKAVIR